MDIIQIGGKHYTVDFCDSTIKYGDSRAGFCRTDIQIIVINNRNPFESQVEVLLHEVIEIINGQCTLDLTHQTISTLGELLFQVLPQISKLLKE